MTNLPETNLCDDCLKRMVERNHDPNGEHNFKVYHTNGHALLCQTNDRNIARKAVAKHLVNNPNKRITEYRIHDGTFTLGAFDFFTPSELKLIENHIKSRRKNSYQLGDFNYPGRLSA
ncbi:MAG: hypothetical protein ABJI69_09145 [Balneola sp.]